MTCTLSRELLEDVVSFHGHNCPGLTIGIRAAEYALLEFKNTNPDDLVCITETDMCAVDGIQFLTQCTLGKGNLIHRDYGKPAFSFFDRNSGKALRLLLRPDAKGDSPHNKKGRITDSNGSSGSDTKTGPARHQEIIQRLLELPLQKIFDVEQLGVSPPRGARVLASISCAHCGEETMESRTRRMAGEVLCIPCFDKVEQKV